MLKHIKILSLLSLLLFSFTVCAKTQSKNSTCIPPGVTYSTSASSFAIWSPDTSNVQLYLDGKIYQMNSQQDCNGYTQLYTATINGDFKSKPYHFLINGVSVRDPYGRMIDVNDTNNDIVMDVDHIQPDGGWASLPKFDHAEDAVIYETNIRDFTYDPTSGVDSDKRGTYAGMTQSGTTYQGVSTGIDHLKELGVTHIQLMPFYDYGTCTRADVKQDPSCYNWGYDPINYNVPEWRYSQYGAYDANHYPERIKEVQNMINALHKAGFRVVMDVVYNHTYTKDVFENITSKYYLSYDLSGTSGQATLDDSNPMVSRMIRDSLEYWVKEYHVDGFRFDLLGIFHYQVAANWIRYLRQEFLDRNLLVYGEPWDGGIYDPQEDQKVRLGTIARTELDDNGNMNPAHMGVFNSQFRDALKGDNNAGTGGGYIFNQPRDPDEPTLPIYQGSRGAIRAPSAKDPSVTIQTWDPQFAGDPEEDINYVSCHDNLTLWDKINEWAALSGRAGDKDYLKRVDEFATGIIFTSEGIPFIHGGSEILRTKNDDHNSYKSNDKINDIHWDWKTSNPDVFNYYKKIVALRKAHPALRMTSWDAINDHVYTYGLDHNVLEIMIKKANEVGDSWKNIIIFYNPDQKRTLSINGTWNVAMELGNPPYDPKDVHTVTNQVVVDGTAVTILYQE